MRRCNQGILRVVRGGSSDAKSPPVLGKHSALEGCVIQFSVIAPTPGQTKVSFLFSNHSLFDNKARGKY